MAKRKSGETPDPVGVDNPAEGSPAPRASRKRAIPAPPTVEDAPRVLRREERDPRLLVASPRNARTHSDEQVEQLRALVRRFGFTSAVLVRDDGGVEGEIIAGAGRTRAAVLEGLPLVPVVVADGWSEDEVRAYMIADNQVALNAGWDETILRAELTELDALDFDVGLIGFSDVRLAELLPPEAGDAVAPDGFPAHDETVTTAYCCPKCGYRWSGKADPAAPST